MALSEIPATSSTVVPAEAEQTFDKWRLVSLQTKNTNANKLRVRATFRKARKDGDDWVLAPDTQANNSVLKIDDLYSISSADSNVETALNTLIGAMVTLGVQQGVL